MVNVTGDLPVEESGGRVWSRERPRDRPERPAPMMAMCWAWGEAILQGGFGPCYSNVSKTTDTEIG